MSDENESSAELVDRTLIIEMLRLTPEERLRLHDDLVTGLLELREAFEQSAHGK